MYNYIQESGTIVPDTGDLLTEVETEFKNALGSNLDVSPETPQGVLITAETIARDAVVRNNAALANQINPNLAGGVFLDAIAALTGLARRGASRSLVTGTLTGVNGTVVPAGVRVRTTANDLFELLNQVVIGSGGTVAGTFRAVETGAIEVPIGTLVNIVDGVLGWESITNAAEAALGLTEQSDYELRELRRNTLALQGVALPEAITSGLANVEGVRSFKFRENFTGSPITIDSETLVAHSVYACVDGGSDADVAAALLKKKSMGANWNGGITVNVTDQFSGQVYPVKFDRPTAVPILIRTTVKPENALIDAVATVKQAIMSYVNGLQEGEKGFQVGENVSTWELGGAINRLQPRIYVQSLEISDDDGVTWQTGQVVIEISQIATTNDSSITVTLA